jgi:hypothetical protein
VPPIGDLLSQFNLYSQKANLINYMIWLAFFFILEAAAKMESMKGGTKMKVKPINNLAHIQRNH